MWVLLTCPLSHFVINGKQSQMQPFLSQHQVSSNLPVEGTLPCPKLSFHLSRKPEQGMMANTSPTVLKMGLQHLRLASN